MKVRRQLARLEEIVLQSLQGVTGEDWHRAPKGRWTIAQTLSHLAQGLDAVVGRLEGRAGRSDMERRANPGQHLLRHLVLGVGKLPPGRRSPEGTLPPERPDPRLVTAQYRMAVERMGVLVETWPPEQQQRVFVHHPVLGDLSLPEWVRFFYVHGRHHAHQIVVRRRWLKEKGQQVQQGQRDRKGEGKSGKAKREKGRSHRGR